MGDPPLGQVGVFQMEECGLTPVADPSALFVSDRSLAPGVSSAVTVMMEGTRPMLVEVQALCSPVANQVRSLLCDCLELLWGSNACEV